MRGVEAFKPSPALAGHVTDIWAYEIPRGARAGEPARLTLLPDGYPTMVFLHGAPLRATIGSEIFETRSAVCGFHARPVQLECDGDVGGLTVRFRPDALCAFVPGSLEEVAERRVECRDVFPARAIEALEDELAALPTSVARVRRVEAFLTSMLRPDAVDPLVGRALARMLEPAGAPRTVRELAREVAATERTLERTFRRSVGATPKTFSRVVRIQRALQQRARRVAWSQLALDAGYADQAHLVRDAKQLLGASPEVVVRTDDTPLGKPFRELARTAHIASTIFR